MKHPGLAWQRNMHNATSTSGAIPVSRDAFASILPIERFPVFILSGNHRFPAETLAVQADREITKLLLESYADLLTKLSTNEP